MATVASTGTLKSCIDGLSPGSYQRRRLPIRADPTPLLTSPRDNWDLPHQHSSLPIRKNSVEKRDSVSPYQAKGSKKECGDRFGSSTNDLLDLSATH
jgi:hypothetical protein